MKASCSSSTSTISTSENSEFEASNGSNDDKDGTDGEVGTNKDPVKHSVAVVDKYYKTKSMQIRMSIYYITYI